MGMESRSNLRMTTLAASQDLRGGAGTRASTSASTAAPTADLRSVEADVFKVASSLQQLKRLVEVLGTPKDTVDHRRRIVELNATIQRLARGVKEGLTGLHAAAEAGGGASHGSTGHAHGTGTKVQKLLADFATMLQEYKSTAKLAQERETASLPRPNPIVPPLGGRAGGGAAGGRPPLGPASDLEQGLLQRDEEEEKQVGVGSGVTWVLDRPQDTYDRIGRYRSYWAVPLVLWSNVGVTLE